MNTLQSLARALESGETTSVALLDQCLSRAMYPAGEGARVYLKLREAAAVAQARAMDEARARGRAPSRWAGIPISVKDLFDVAGEVTRAGSTLLADAAPARATAPAIARLEAAGFVLVGRTNMTEFAYSGVGINPHYGTPLNPFDRATGRIPGGSSSGAAVSVTDGMAAAGIGTDTGGSCRIPAALTGITGYKPTASSVPLEGVYPLSKSLDSVGSLANSVGCCAVLHGLMSRAPITLDSDLRLADLRLGVLDHYVTADMDETVSAAYGSALDRLDRAGVQLSSIRLPEIESLPTLNARGGIAAAEAYALHREQLERHPAAYDPRVGNRIFAGRNVSIGELDDIRRARAGMIAAFAQTMRSYDALLAPTVPVVAPPLAAFDRDDEYVRLNLLLLRNPSLFNFLDGCAISVPVHDPGTAPVGLMLAAPAGSDASLLGTAAAVEALFL